MKQSPIFELLREQRELSVINPATGVRFTIMLRDWQGALWAVWVLPATPRPADAVNPFVQRHRLLARSVIEEWLERLRLEQIRLSTRIAASRRASAMTSFSK
jgi:hypothetical protein